MCLKILGIITARADSKGILFKNIQMLAGKPLIEYSISSAKKSKINRLIVSTDSKKIATISRSLGAEVPFIRPKSLAKDDSQTIDVIKHALNFLSNKEDYTPDIISILQPTSPFREASMINKSIQILSKSNTTSVISVSKVKTHPYKSFWYTRNFLKPYKHDFELYFQRQKYPILYYPTGSIYTFWYKTLKKYNSIYGPHVKPIIEDDFYVDIDSPMDLFISEMMMLHWKKYKKKFQ